MKKRFIMAVGLNGENCLLDTDSDFDSKFVIDDVYFSDPFPKSGVYLVECVEPVNPIFDYKYRGTAKLLYHPQILDTEASLG